jgi:hypothetical protein
LLSVNVVPETTLLLIFVYEPPETVDLYTLYPLTPLEVLAVQLSATECVVVTAAPVPDRGIPSDVFDALLVTVIVPL